MPHLFPPKPSLWISGESLSSLEEQASAAAPNETGGVLMGYWRRDSRDVVVTHAIGPGANATAEPERFEPDAEFHATEVARIYHGSGRTITYLGDWHSHPTGHAYLSPADHRTLEWIALDPAARAERPVMLILSGRNGWRCRAWMATPLNWSSRLLVVFEIAVRSYREHP